MPNPKNIFVNVTMEDIEEAKKDYNYGRGPLARVCPIARAFIRIGFTLAFVQEHVVYDVGKHAYFLPKKVQNFIIKFDKKEEVKPIKFKLKPKDIAL